jgi:hypothetical protein
MSSLNSNFYSSRIYGEHPAALWAMDEPNYFVSLISEEEKEITTDNWDFTNAISSSAQFTLSGYPFNELPVNKIYLSTASPRNFKLSLTEPIPYLKFDRNKGTVSTSTYVYVPDTTSILYIDIGFIVNSEETYTRYTSSYIKTNNWEKISNTSDYSYNNFTPFVRVVFDENTSEIEEESSVYFNGLSVGQWSEAYSSISTGVQVENLPSNIKSLINFEGDIQCTILDSYGFNDGENGYILSLNNSLLGHLSAISMVYGSNGNMKLNKNSLRVFDEIIDAQIDGLSIDGGSASSVYAEFVDGGDSSIFLTLEQYNKFPSLVFPGKGFLNQFGYNKLLTTEFWLRINPEKISQARIFGPLSSDDGLYVDKDFIRLNIGGYSKSYFIGKWYRPMLIHICQSENEIFLMINGEKVISIDIEGAQIETFPIPEEDYLGFFTDSEIYLYEIDSFSIFPYVVQEQVAKKRYVFGQGVQEQENIISSNNGELSYIDFPFSGYGSTIRYPDRTKWTDGFYNNIVASPQGISLPKYNVPEIIFNNVTNISNSEKSLISSNFYKENYEIQDEDNLFISMDPNNSYIDQDSYGTLYFAQINQTNYKTQSLYSVMKSSSNVATKQSLLYLSNNVDASYFEISINSGSISYIFNDQLINSASIQANSYFSVGIDFDKIEKAYQNTLLSFFSRPENISLNFGGNQNNVFLGKIFSLTINNQFFTEKDGEAMFNLNGIAIKDSSQNFLNYAGSYTLIPKATNIGMFLDVAVSGYWENSIPLSYFGKYITQSDGELKYDLDLIQFDIDSPKSIFSKYNQESSNYEDSLSTKIYLTLQKVSGIGQFTYTQFTNTEIVGMDKILDLSSILSEKDTKYKVNSGTVIYPPKDIQGFANYYITIHIELKSNGINSENVNIKNMALSSLSFDEGQFYAINTPAEGKFYPIAKNEDQYVYKRKIPVLVDIDSSPYLYLSGDSGIEVLPEIDENLLKGISIPINKNKKNNQKVVGIQMFLMFNEDKLFNERKKIGSIFSSNNSYDIVLVPETDKKRATFKIYETITGIEFETAKFFLNGKAVNSIVIEPLVWNCIAISLQENSISLDGIIAQMEFYSGLKINNVASFMELNPIEQNLVTYDDWGMVDDEYWSFWSASATWTQALDPKALNITILSLDAKNIFDNYIGTSLGVASDSSTLNVNYDSVVILNDVKWSTYLL